MNVLIVVLDVAGTLDVGDAEVLVVAPALNSRLKHWLSDEDAARRKAEERATACADRVERTGAHARSSVGDADPVQAIADALATFPADEIVISADPEHSRRLASRARNRFALPVLRAEECLPHAA
jgi:nucleotide-binding universal stress UspA family protein